jgi:hypothetical protein
MITGIVVPDIGNSICLVVVLYMVNEKVNPGTGNVGCVFGN